MKKIKIIIFGITGNLFAIQKKELDFSNVELIAFADNNPYKFGIKYENIPIVSPKEIVSMDYDYILVSAWRSYDAIKKQLMEMGISEEKINIFLQEKVTLLYPGKIVIEDKEVVKKIYIKGENYLEIIEKFQEISQLWEQYSSWNPMNSDNEAWYKKGTMISHALGGKVHGIKRRYSNSKEALEYSLKTGFRLLECDAWKIENGEVILAHDAEDILDGQRGCYTIQTIRDVLEVIKKYPDVSLLVDVKWEKGNDYKNILDAIESSVQNIEKTESEQKILKSQIIMEVYNEETIQYAKEKGYQCFFTQYRNLERDVLIKTIALCYKYNINVVGFGIETALGKYGNYLKLFTDKNIHVFCFSTDSLEEYEKVMKMGLDGVFTNYLSGK